MYGIVDNNHTLSAVIAQGYNYIIISRGNYTEPITVSNVTLQADSDVYINGLTVSNVTMYGGNYSNLTTLDKVVIKNSVLSLTNNGILEISNSKILSLINNKCTSVYNSFIFSSITSSTGNITLTHNVFCGVSNLLCINNTSTKSFNNTTISNTDDFTAYIATGSSYLESSNNTFRITSPTPYVGSSIDTSTIITTGDNWITVDDIIPSRNTLFGTSGNYDCKFTVNGCELINSLYTHTANISSDYTLQPKDFLIRILDPGGNITLPLCIDGRIVCVKNNSNSNISVNEYILRPQEGNIFISIEGNWEIISASSTINNPQARMLLVNNTMYVDEVYGDNTTAVLNNSMLPAATIEYAASIAPPDAVIHVRPGKYSPTTGFNDHKFYFEPRSIITWSGSNALFTGSTQIHGYGRFICRGLLTDIVDSTIDAISITNQFLGTCMILNSSIVNIRSLTNEVDGDVLISMSNKCNLQIDKVMGRPRQLLYSTDSSFIIDSISHIHTLVCGNNNIGRVNNIALHSDNYLFDCSNSMIDINNIVTSNGLLHMGDNTQLKVDTWKINDTIGNWQLGNNTILSIEFLVITNSGTEDTPLFVANESVSIDIKQILSTNSCLMRSNSITSLHIDKYTCSPKPLRQIILRGQFTLDIHSIQYTGNNSFIYAEQISEVSYIHINNFTGTSLISLINDRLVTIDVSKISSTSNIVLITHQGLPNSNLYLNVNSLDIQDRLLVTNGYITANISGRVKNNAFNSIIECNASGNIDINLTHMNVNISSSLVRLLGSPIDTVNISMSSIRYYSTQPLIDLSNVTSMSTYNININNIVTNSYIVSYPNVPLVFNLCADNIETSSTLAHINYISDNCIRICARNINANLGNNSLITTSGKGTDNDISIDISGRITSGNLISSCGDIKLFINTSYLRILAGYIVKIVEGYGSYVRISGKYIVNNIDSAIIVNTPPIESDTVISGICLQFAEIGGKIASILHVDANITENAYLQYKFISNMSVLSTTNTINIVGGGSAILVNNTNSLVVSSLLIN